mmetsp:Transcript_8987/g.15629  ORF Transcript_8987/g.15629 Transcript_8987/m.15629 type:complete len:336 (-) Transcript_8987:104-1111(-)
MVVSATRFHAGNTNQQYKPVSIMTATSPAIRPYTSYNLFFQLEREYILQMLKGFKPDLSPNERFDPSDAKSYGGPPLPPRYRNLTLRSDWHIPGKTQRRKRKHRKTHGKIGFHELNERISLAWSMAEEEIRRFCAMLSEIESKKYKSSKMDSKKNEAKKNETKKMNHKTTKKNDKKVVKKTERVVKKRNQKSAKTAYKKKLVSPKENFEYFDWTKGFDAECEEIVSCQRLRRTVSCESINSINSKDKIQSNIEKRSFPEVDMKDEEIYDIWNAIPTLDQKSSTTVKEEKLSQRNTIMSSIDIDAEYEKFKMLGERFSFQQMLVKAPRRALLTVCP